MRGSQRSPPNSCTLSWAACALSGAHDHILHGVPFRREDLSVEWRDGFDILTNQPSILVSALMADCEIQFANWANNTSVARFAAGASRVGLELHRF